MVTSYTSSHFGEYAVTAARTSPVLEPAGWLMLSAGAAALVAARKYASTRGKA